MSRARDAVVLVHGLWFSGWSLRLLQRRLARAGFDAHVFSYPSVSCDLREAGDALRRYAERLSSPTIHFVGHSLGGLVIRALFHFHPDAVGAGRIVTLGTPHGGSAVARRLAAWRLPRRLLGRGIDDMMRGVPEGWVPPARPIGVIAGDYSLGLGRLIARFAEANDGTVTVTEACWRAANDSLVMPVSHFGMLFMPGVSAQIACFLRSGAFCR